MPRLLPFAGLRPDPQVTGALTDVACPPYDVITEEQRLALLGRSPFNVVRIELPAGDYEGAARLLGEWQASGALKREAQPALYGYRMTCPAKDGQVARQTLGVIGALVLEAPGKGILPHEHTTPKAKSDRLELLQATRANTSPIWCLCTEAGLAAALGSAEGTQVATAVDEEGNTHELWPVFDPATHDAVAKIVAASPVLVADGHHRYETALAYQAQQAPARDGAAAGTGKPASASAPGHDGHDALMSLVVELSEEHLEVMAIHRMVAGLPQGTDVLGAFRHDFSIAPAPAAPGGLLETMRAQAAIGVVTPEGAYLARPQPGSQAAAFALDSSRVDAALASLPTHRLTYEHDLEAMLSQVRAGQADAAVLCRPATVAQIAATARGGERMPPKTTFFWPKPRTGMVLRAW